MPPGSRPPGAPRKQAHPMQAAGPSRRTNGSAQERSRGAYNSVAERMPRMRSVSSSRTASQSSSQISSSIDHDTFDNADAATPSAALFGSGATRGPASLPTRAGAGDDEPAYGHHALASAQRGQAWLSQRSQMGSTDVDQSSLALLDTPTSRAGPGHGSEHNHASVVRAADDLAGAQATPSNAGTRSGEPSLFSQITRRLAAARRPHFPSLRPNHETPRNDRLDDAARGMESSSAAAARASLAASSGWGSPRGMNGSNVDSLRELGLSAPINRPTSVSGHQEFESLGSIGGPETGEARSWALRAPPPPPFSTVGTATVSVAPTNHDGSYSVIRDEADANNSGLLALTPAVRKLPGGLDMTAVHPRSSKASSDTSFLQAPGELSKGARSSEPSDRSLGLPPSIIEYPLEGVDVASADEMEARRARLLERNGDHVAPNSEARAALLETMRAWREDAMKHHLYDTAIFWGNKVLSMETTQTAWNDAYNLATAYFLTHRYAQAQQLLCSPLQRASQRAPLKRGADAAEEPSVDQDDELGRAVRATHRSSRLPPSMLSKTHVPEQIAESDFDEVSDTESVSRLPSFGKRKHREFTTSGTGTASETGSAGVTEAMSDDAEDVNDRKHPEVATNDKGSKRAKQPQNSPRMPAIGSVPPPDAVCLVDVSIPCKYLAAQCMVRMGRHQEALDELDVWGGSSDEEAFNKSCRQSSKDGLIKLASSIWHLKGLIHLYLRHIDAARESFIKSLSLDVKNFESFDQLVRGNLLTFSEQWDLVDNLHYIAQSGSDPILGDALQMVRLMYTSLLDKSCKSHIQRTSAARLELTEVYGLDDNPDVLLSLAEELYARMRYRETYRVTQRIMELSKDHEAALTIHISSMQAIADLWPSLYLLAHHLTDADPDLPAAWYAVGCWYFSTQRWLEARKHFSKSVQIDPRFTPGWVAFAHTFAHEGESDQAIVSYSTAERNFSSHYLIKLFLGMEHLSQGNLTLAQLYLGGSAEVWEEDPLSRNERGVVAYYNGRTEEAIELLLGALDAAKSAQQPAAAWASTHLNLAHAYRRCNKYHLARTSYLHASELDPDCNAAFVGVGMCFHSEGKLDDALAWYHRALSIEPADKNARELAFLALHESAQAPPSIFALRVFGSHKRGTNDERDKIVPSMQNGTAVDARVPGAARGEFSTENGSNSNDSYSMSLAEGSASINMENSSP